MESIVRDTITQHLDKFNLIKGSQLGFSGGSVHVLQICLSRKTSKFVTFLDFTKAFRGVDTYGTGGHVPQYL